jgi:predicted lipoprotein with Yx(FWY)xxD motif
VKKTFPAFAALALIAVLAIAGCGSSSDNSSSSSSGGAYGSGGESTTKPASSKASSSGTAAVITAASAPKLGKIIVDSKGFTLYDFHKDKGTTSACYGGCAQVWPPLLSEGKPQAGEGAMASKLGTTERKDGTTQVTYAGHPLYTYEADTKPGDAKGNDFTSFGGEWYALQPSGEEAEG